MSQGIIQGGWGYVIAVYSISWVVMLGYAAALLRGSRQRALAQRDQEPSSPGRAP